MVNYFNTWSYRVSPGVCRRCHAPSRQPRDICSRCEAELPWLDRCCEQCALLLPSGRRCGRCQRRPPAFDHCLSSWRYGFPIDRLVSAYKHQKNRTAGIFLADLWLQQHRAQAPLPDQLIPVPLHWKRLLSRGFNQSEELARIWGSALAIPVSRALLRQTPTPSQQQLSAAERRRNLRHAFRLADGHTVDGLHIALVDDVLTTGATAHAAAGILKRAGARRVDVWFLARTP